RRLLRVVDLRPIVGAELVPLLTVVVVPFTQLGGRCDITQPPVEIRLLFRHAPGPHPVHENPGLAVRGPLRIANTQRTSLEPTHREHLLVPTPHTPPRARSHPFSRG